ncbi:MAG TPA: VanW family protein [Fimbriimonadaceae bacterium]|nr:VanW family protein [Fimbriimonadaceae bacterium]
MALDKSADGLDFVLSERRSPLRRAHVADERLQAGKEHNVALVAAKIDGIVIEPGKTFSFHHAVGRPSRLRGFWDGLELHSGVPSHGVGGGACQVSNLLYLLAIEAGLDIVERHRHALDLFPDHGRTAPFGCGATVFYNSADLRFANRLDMPVAIRLKIEAGHLAGQIRSESDPGLKVEIYEVGHRFERQGDAWWRENRIRRRFIDAAGNVVSDEEVAHNLGRCLYDPENPDG